jgi:hypothetical protein
MHCYANAVEAPAPKGDARPCSARRTRDSELVRMRTRKFSFGGAALDAFPSRRRGRKQSRDHHASYGLSCNWFALGWKHDSVAWKRAVAVFESGGSRKATHAAASVQRARARCTGRSRERRLCAECAERALQERRGMSGCRARPGLLRAIPMRGVHHECVVRSAPSLRRGLLRGTVWVGRSRGEDDGVAHGAPG